MRPLLFLLMVGLLMPNDDARAAEPEPGDHSLTVTSTWDGTEQPFRLFVPRRIEKGDPLPLVVVLHGKGVDQNAWFDLTPIKAAAERHGYVAVAPYGRGNFWYRGAGEQDVLDIVAEAGRLCPIDESRVYLVGHSMGGWGTWWISLRNPDVFATAVSMSGFAPEDLLPSAEGLNPFVLHDETDPIVDVRNSREPVARLAELGISHRYAETHGYGHSSGLIGDSLDDVFAWFAAHRRPESPDHVRLAVRTPRKGAAWWLRVLETAGFPAAATIDARVAEGTLAVSTADVRRFAVDTTAAALDGVATAEVDGAALVLPDDSRFAEFTRGAGGWSVAGTEEVQAADSPVANCEGAGELATLGQEELVGALSKVLIEETGADLALFDRDDFNWQGGPLTRDRLTDLYCYAVEDLVLVSVSGADLAAKLQEGGLPGVPVLAPVSAGELEERAYRLLAPERLLFSLPEGVVERLPLRPDEYFVRRAERKGCFP